MVQEGNTMIFNDMHIEDQSLHSAVAAMQA
jgi:hypothetical protein